MTQTLIVLSPFLNYQPGDSITDPTIIGVVLSNPSWSKFVIASGYSTSTVVTPTTTLTPFLDSNIGPVYVDNSTIGLTPEGILYAIPQPGSTSSTSSVTSIGVLTDAQLEAAWATETFSGGEW